MGVVVFVAVGTSAAPFSCEVQVGVGVQMVLFFGPLFQKRGTVVSK